MPASHSLHPALDTLHGQFSPLLAPALTVDSGDVVHLHTLDVTWGLENHRGLGLDRPRLERPADDPRYQGPAMLGPIAVRGASAGATLRVDILDVRPGPWGWTFVGGSTGPNAALNRALALDAEEHLVLWQVDADTGVAQSDLGHTVPLRPFPGVLGLAPSVPGWHSGWQPRNTGGNMDCRELIAGHTLFLPVEVEGALLSAGDGHAAQGDGEVGGSAIECRLDPLTLRLTALDSPAPPGPRIRTHDAWIALGFGSTLDDAAADALNNMLDLMHEQFELGRHAAAAIASAVVDLRVTQLVNGIVGVHAVLADARLHC